MEASMSLPLPRTSSACSELERRSGIVPDVRAYKLGKNKCSYNQVQLSILQQGKEFRVLEVVETAEDSTVPSVDNGLYYFAKLRNGQVVRVAIFAVYAIPKESDDGMYEWTIVRREHCKKSCTGRILKPIQRFGRLGRRNSLSEEDNKTAKDMWKETKHFFISIDEASTHIPEHNSTQKMRLLFGIYDVATKELLGSSVSGPIRVLANNDVPKGAASIIVDAKISESWVGWDDKLEESTPLPKAPSRSPLATVYSMQESPCRGEPTPDTKTPKSAGFATPASTLAGVGSNDRKPRPDFSMPAQKKAKTNIDAQRKLSLGPPTPRGDATETTNPRQINKETQQESHQNAMQSPAFLPQSALAADPAYAAYLSHYSLHPALFAQAQEQYWKCIEAWRVWYARMMPLCMPDVGTKPKGGVEEHTLPSTPAPVRISKVTPRRESL